MSRVVQPTHEQLERRRRALLERLGGDFDKVNERAGRHDLEGDEWWAWEELRSIDFLLDGESSGSDHR
jgi:hypothetical protein